MASSYLELLKDPRWQKKRLEIFELDHWQCRNCESKTGTLNVHHLFYEKGKKPWEYDNSCLLTLCEKCHKEAHSINWQRAFLDLQYTPQQLLEIALSIKFKCNKAEALTKPVRKKYNIRFNPIVISVESSLFDDTNELIESFGFIHENKPKYTNG